MTINIKTMLGFEVPLKVFEDSNYKRTCGCSDHHMKQMPTTSGTFPMCDYHKKAWTSLVTTFRKGYDKKEGTYKSIYSVVLPFSGDYTTPIAVVGIDLGHVFLDGQQGSFKSSFDCVSMPLETLEVRYDLELLSHDLGVEYDSLRIHTVMFNS